MESRRIYEGLMRCENGAADLYLDLSTRFSDRADISWFWVEIAMEDKQQAGLLHHCLEEQVFAEELPTLEEITSVQNRLEKLRAKLAGSAPNLDDAFAMAIQLTASQAEHMCQRLTAPISSPLHLVRKKFELSKQTHAHKLKEAARRFGASSEITSQLDELV